MKVLAVVGALIILPGAKSLFYTPSALDIKGMYQKASVPMSYEEIVQNCFAGLQIPKCKLKSIYEGKAGSIVEATTVSNSRHPGRR